MDKDVKNQIKSLLALRGIKLKELSEKLNERNSRKYTPNSLSQRLGRGSITYNEVLQIAEILGYDIEFKDNGNEMV